MLKKKQTATRAIMGALLLWLASAMPAVAQGTVPQASIAAELKTLTAAAQTIFVGQIVQIQRKGGVVEVRFRVEQPVAGAAGQTFTLREWAGLWPLEVQRYSVGQRVLAFVHASSAAGLSSPVRGAEGMVPVVVQGAHAPRLLDIRRVAASVVRLPGTRLPDETDGAVALDAVINQIAAGQQATPLPSRLPLPGRLGRPVDISHIARATRLSVSAAAPNARATGFSGPIAAVRP